MRAGAMGVAPKDDSRPRRSRRVGPALAALAGVLLLLGSCAHRPAHDGQVPGAAPGAAPSAQTPDGQAADAHGAGAHAAHAAHAGHEAMHASAGRASSEDRRQTVEFPPLLKEHTLSNMRDHLLALQEIQLALSGHAFDGAADLAEQRLGMSSLALHGAHEVARFMPKGMQDAGTAMHRAASRFAIAARDAGASGDLRPALAALSDLTGACVACHAAYRLK